MDQGKDNRSTRKGQKVVGLVKEWVVGRMDGWMEVVVDDDDVQR